MSLSRIQHWIFDLDGTLTVAEHDFDAIRAELGLPSGEPILEALSGLPTQQGEAIFLTRVPHGHTYFPQLT